VYSRLDTNNVSYDLLRLSACQNDGTHKTRKVLTSKKVRYLFYFLRVFHFLTASIDSP
jgi:hypothetical protein